MKKVFARTKRQKKHKEICWWNEEVSVVVNEKKLLFRNGLRSVLVNDAGIIIRADSV